MGIHSGTPLRAEGRYFGLDVNRAARICAAGRGGQVLLSDTAHDELAGRELEGIYLHDMGEQRLKDFDEPQRVYLAEIAGLEQATGLRRESDLSTPAALPKALRVVVAVVGGCGLLGG